MPARASSRCRRTAATSVQRSILLHVHRVAGLAGEAQLRDLILEGRLGIGAARLEGNVRRNAGTLVEIRKAGPDLRRREGIDAGVAMNVGFPLIGARREQMRKC